MKVKLTISIILLFLVGCSEKPSGLVVVAVQHIGKGIMKGDACKTLYREDDHAVTTPQNFKISPFEAIGIANEELGYSCTNKFGAQILADEQSYYIVRLGSSQDAIMINGINGVVESKGFMERER